MGFKLRLISNSQAIIDAAWTSFGRFGPVSLNQAPDFTFRLFEHKVDESQLGQPLFRMDGPLLYLTSGPEATLVADLADGLAYGYFSAPTLAHQAYFRWHFLELAFFQMLEARGFMGVHGAAVAKAGQAILLRAQSGGGKTTLAYAGARHSLQALAEDVVWLDEKQGLWWGMPWSFHLLPDAKNLFPELSPYDPILQTNDELKLEINLETIRPDSTTFCAQPRAVLFVERLTGSQSRLESIDRATAHALWPAGRTGLEMQRPHHAEHINRLLSDNPAYRFYFGDDIEAGVALLASLFD